MATTVHGMAIGRRGQVGPVGRAASGRGVVRRTSRRSVCERVGRRQRFAKSGVEGGDTLCTAVPWPSGAGWRVPASSPRSLSARVGLGPRRPGSIGGRDGRGRRWNSVAVVAPRFKRGDASYRRPNPGRLRGTQWRDQPRWWPGRPTGYPAGTTQVPGRRGQVPRCAAQVPAERSRYPGRYPKRISGVIGDPLARDIGTSGCRSLRRCGPPARDRTRGSSSYRTGRDGTRGSSPTMHRRRAHDIPVGGINYCRLARVARNEEQIFGAATDLENRGHPPSIGTSALSRLPFPDGSLLGGPRQSSSSRSLTTFVLPSVYALRSFACCCASRSFTASYRSRASGLRRSRSRNRR